MKITKIEKKKRLYLLELDTTEKLYVTEDTIVRFMLSKDKDVSPEQLQEIREFAQFSYGKNLALYYISFKQRTKKEVSDYLQQHDVESDSIQTILETLEAENWVNDRAYTERMLFANQLSGDKGPLLLQQTLTRKGICKHLLTEEMEAVDFDCIAERLAQKLFKRYQAKYPQKALEQKIIQGLLSKGFTYQQATRSVNELDFFHDEETEEDLLHKELEKQFRKLSRRYEGFDLKQRLTQTLARKGFDFGKIQSALREYI